MADEGRRDEAGSQARLAPSFPAVHLDFESGTLAGWNTRRLAGPHSARAQSEIVRIGRYACRFELRPGDYVSQGRRAELKDPFNAPYDEPVWYGFSFLIPEDFPVAEPAGCVVAQWHDQAILGDPSGKPLVALRYREGSLVVTGAYARVASPDPDLRHAFLKLARFPLGRWHDVVLRAVFSRFGTSEIDLWLDGEKRVAWEGRLGYENQPQGPYFKLGMYASGDFARTMVVYHDNYSRGHAYAEVDPSVLHSGERA